MFNIVTTDKHAAAVGKMIRELEIVKKDSTMGSTDVGKILMQQASATLKKLSMEPGGNAPLISQ